MSRLILVLVSLSLPALAACGQAKADAPAAAPTAAPPKTFAKADTAVVTAASVPDLISVTGTVQPFERSDLVADVSGKIIEVLVDRGSVVAAGDPLLRLDTRSAALSEREARANLGSLKTQQRLADDTCRRSKELLDKGAITATEYERDLAACTRARDEVAAASARLGKANQTVVDGVIRAPFAGIIAERFVSLGEYASPQAKLFTLVDDHALRADLSLSEAASVYAKLGAEVALVPVADRKRTVVGTISRIGVEIDPKTRALLVEVAVPNDSGLRAGMFVEGRLAVGERTLPVVPKSALVKRGATWRLFAVVGERLEERVLQLGPDTATGQATIVRGLVAGETYATKVAPDTRDGTQVE